MADGNLRSLFRTHLPEGFWQSVETSGVGRGVPDAHVLFPGGKATWIEFKGTDTFKAGLRPEQIAWISRYARMGGRVYVAVRYEHKGGPRKGPPADDLYLFAGRDVSQLAEYGILSPLPVAKLTGGVRNWNWDLIRAVL